VKRLSPQPVVSVRPLVKEKPSCRHQGHPGTRTRNPDLAPQPQGPEPAVIRTATYAEQSSVLSRASAVPSSRTACRQIGVTPGCSKHLARGGEDRFCAEASCTQSITSAIGPVICPERGPAANTPPEAPHGFQIANSSPYFSSSLTLSIRGAVSPARHVLTRPRPHPVSRQEGERTAGSVFVQQSDEDCVNPVVPSLS
jgi:hypothetical protein